MTAAWTKLSAMTRNIPAIVLRGRRAVREQLHADGFVGLPRFMKDASLECVAASLGELISAWGGPAVHELVPRADATPNTYSGIFGLGRFPFHTDLAHWAMPPRYILLRCVRGYADVPTILIDGARVVANIGLVEMNRALMTPRRPRKGKVQLLSLAQREGSSDMIRWDEVFLKPASPVGQRVFDRVRVEIDAAHPTPVAMVDPGDAVIIDNWRMLHARPLIKPGRTDRRLERVYLKDIA